MKTIDVAEAQSPLSKYLKGLDEPVVFVSEGVPVAALLPVANDDMESVSLSLNPDFIRIMEESRGRQAKEGGLTPEEMRLRLGLERDVARE